MGATRIGIEELMSRKTKRQRHVVAGVVPVGLTLLASRPKLGKSWWVFDLAISVASGREFLDRPVDSGDVLYWALEDSEERLQTRAIQLLNGAVFTHRLDIETVGSRITPDTAYEGMCDWIEEAKNPKLIIIDTLKKIRKSRNGGGMGYDSDYDFGDKLQKLAHKHGVAIVLVYHTTKAIREDFVDEVQDTTGMTAVPDNVMVLKRRRGSVDAELHMAPKDFNETTLKIQHDQETGRWTYQGEVDEQKVNRPEVRRKVIEFIASRNENQSPLQVSEGIGIPLATLRTYLRRMVDYGELLNVGYGAYTLTDSVREELGLSKAVTPPPTGVVISRTGGRRLTIPPKKLTKPARKPSEPRKKPGGGVTKAKGVRKPQTAKRSDTDVQLDIAKSKLQQLKEKVVTRREAMTMENRLQGWRHAPKDTVKLMHWLKSRDISESEFEKAIEYLNSQYN